jgi:uncharacterized membrane protein (UPF0182 family)
VALTILRGGAAVFAGLFAFANLYAVRQSVVSLVFPRRVGDLEIGEEVPGRYLLTAAIALSVVLGVLLALPQNDWTSFVLARDGRPFGEIDPYFGQDLGFFVYTLPFESELWTWVFMTVAVVGITVILLYALTPSLKWQRGASLYASTYVRRHLTALIGILLLLLAWSYRLDMYALLIDGSGELGAFAYVDHHVGIPGDLLLALVTLGAALIVIWAAIARQLRLAAISIIAVVVFSIIIRGVAPAIVSHSGTDAEQTARERPYLETRAGYTRRAFGVDRITLADSSLAYQSLSEAIPWVPAWDPPALSRAVGDGRTGDEHVRIGWRASSNGLVADLVDPPPAGAAPHAPWTVARVIAAGADERGGPLELADPTVAVGDETPVEAPLVYPGAPLVTIVADSLDRVAGSPLDGGVSRLAHAWSLQNVSVFSDDLPQPHPTLISHLDVRDRVDRLTPFFVQGRRVQPLLLGDSLYWAIDLYSASSDYPLSRPGRIAGEDRSYFRHAAVAVVQGVTGEIVIVPDSVLEPVALTWVRALPTIFGTWSALPTGIRPLLAPPIDGLYAQANAFGRYGMRSPDNVVRRVPVLDGADSTLASDNVPIVLPHATSTALVLPLVDDNDRLGGLLIGTGGATQATIWYPLRGALRWSGVLDHLRSVDSTGNTAREGAMARGRVRVVPVRAGVGFVQPTYRWRTQSVPTLEQVALLAGDSATSVAPMRAPLVADSVEVPTRPIPGGSNSVTNATLPRLYSAMRDALRRGDWAAFGRAFDALGRALGQPVTRARLP